MFAALGFLLFLNTARAFDMKEAEEAYRGGDCTKAIELYKQLIATNTLDVQNKAVSYFKVAYCYYTSGKFLNAEDFFARSLITFPKNEEASFRYVDSLFQQGKYSKIIQYAARLNIPSHRNEFRMILGRSYLELFEPEQALEQFNLMNPTIDVLPAQQYWMGVAEFKRGNNKEALIHFERAYRGSKPSDWVHGYAQDWVTALKKVSYGFHGALTLGYFTDGNISSTSYQSSDATTGLPTSLAAVPSTFIKDHGYLLGARLSSAIIDHYPWTLSYQIDWNSPFYSQYSAYNNENAGLEIKAQYVKSSKSTYRASLRFLDSRYLKVYYQDYLIFTPGYTWTPTARLIMSLDIPTTRYIVTRTSTLVGPLLSARFQLFPSLSLNGGLNFSYATGEHAQYSGTTQISGTQFSNYQSLGETVGLVALLPFNFYLSSQASFYKTTYAKEDVTFSGSLLNPGARSDYLFTWYTDLFRAITPFWSMDLAYRYLSNQSAGFQGVATSTSTLIYSYQKPYWLLSTTVQF